jgi:hypothetical protein
MSAGVLDGDFALLDYTVRLSTNHQGLNFEANRLNIEMSTSIEVN